MLDDVIRELNLIDCISYSKVHHYRTISSSENEVHSRMYAIGKKCRIYYRRLIESRTIRIWQWDWNTWRFMILIWSRLLIHTDDRRSKTEIRADWSVEKQIPRESTRNIRRIERSEEAKLKRRGLLDVTLETMTLKLWLWEDWIWIVLPYFSTPNSTSKEIMRGFAWYRSDLNENHTRIFWMQFKVSMILFFLDLQLSNFVSLKWFLWNIFWIIVVSSMTENYLYYLRLHVWWYRIYTTSKFFELTRYSFQDSSKWIPLKIKWHLKIIQWIRSRSETKYIFVLTLCVRYLLFFDFKKTQYQYLCFFVFQVFL